MLSDMWIQYILYVIKNTSAKAVVFTINYSEILFLILVQIIITDCQTVQLEYHVTMFTLRLR